MLATVSFSLLAQAPYEPLKKALGLSDGRRLDDSQRAKLAEIEKVLHSDKLASLAIVIGLISAKQWPGEFPCGYYSVSATAAVLDLSESQLIQLDRLQAQAREPLEAQARVKQKQRLEMLLSGARADSPMVVQAETEMWQFLKQARETRPERDQALAILDDAQKAKLAAFETAMELAREAIEMKLLMPWPRGEPLCQ